MRCWKIPTAERKVLQRHWHSGYSVAVLSSSKALEKERQSCHEDTRLWVRGFVEENFRKYLPRKSSWWKLARSELLRILFGLGYCLLLFAFSCIDAVYKYFR